MRYVDKNLLPDEEVLLRPAYHPVRFLPGALGVLLGVVVASGALVLASATASPGILLAVGGVLVVLGFLAIGFRAAVDSFDEFAITSLRIIKKTGFLKRQVSQIPLDKVQDLRLVATLWGRWLSYGDVAIESAGETGPVVFRRIQDPEAFRNVVFAQRATLAGRPVPHDARLRTVEDRLGDVERLFKTGSLTKEEYDTKRHDLIREL